MKTMPLLGDEIVLTEMNLVALDVGRLEVAHSCVNEDITRWSDIPIRDLGGECRNSSRFPMSWQLAHPVYPRLLHLHIRIQSLDDRLTDERSSLLLEQFEQALLDCDHC